MGGTMKIRRRQFLHLAAGAAALPAMSCNGWAQAYPIKPVRLIVGFAPGGQADIIARLIGQWLAERLGQQFIIENRPGAASNIATEAVVRAVPDGYTLLAIWVGNTWNPLFYRTLNFDFLRDIIPVAGVDRVPGVMVVHPLVPAKTVSEFIAYAKANPGKIDMATSGIGSTGHVYGEMFKVIAGVDLVSVHYRGDAPAITDLLGGQVQVYFSNLAPAIEHIRAGRLRALAVTTAMRSEALPDVASLGEVLPGYEGSGWQGIGAPKNTPMEIIDKLNREVNAAVADPKFKARLADLGLMPMSMNPAEFGTFVASETAKWGRVIRAANIKAE
jgi:tripartite-type tricarboxylate transporter receptor subunit TctC